MGLELDEFSEWKALWIVRAEEQGEADSGDERPRQQSNKQVVTDDAEIAHWFATS